jgi:hypothetical protein
MVVKKPFNWRTVIHRDEFETIRAIQTNDFTYFKVGSALHAQDNIDYAATLSTLVPEDDPIIHDLNTMNESKCLESDKAITSYNNTIEENKSKNLDKPAWRKLLEAEGDTAKGEVIKRIDQVTDAAIARIEQLPEGPAQDTAANVFVQGSKWATQVFNTLCDQVANMLNSILNLLNEAWGAVKAAYNMVKAAVKSGIQAIFGMLKKANKDLVAALTGGVAPVYYKGLVNWPSSSGQWPARIEFERVRAEIHVKGAIAYPPRWIITNSSLDVPQLGVSRGVVEFGNADGSVSLEELKGVWKKAVEEHCKEGYIPSSKNQSNGFNGNKKHRCKFQTVEEYIVYFKNVHGKHFTVSQSTSDT